ncbi:calcium/calmodulin-regulated receptor-like kinase 1 [Chenopodium quinoa]|uniref:calcium/calmodulin-regulated receptor-like kinase 1 n=1 Tax=Chenopodium quinoa TaxID=63459 RepID=UPI000B776724|nr:calcium/calmodulin-regulated receptor-like kinase 1 [Chenopodium quinoa]
MNYFNVNLFYGMSVTLGPKSPRRYRKSVSGMSLWIDGFKRSNVVSTSGILEFAYRDLQKATQNFTTLVGQGAYGPVYKAQMSTGEIVAVKVLVKLLGRLHHRNLLNLLGYFLGELPSAMRTAAWVGKWHLILQRQTPLPPMSLCSTLHQFCILATLEVLSSISFCILSDSIC